MTDPQQASRAQQPVATGATPSVPENQASAFQPIYTLVNNASTKTTHHPRVHYIFSDDDPDVLTQALAQQHDANLNESASGPAPDHRAVLLDLRPDKDGSFNVSWASSLSPSWAVLDAQVSRISPPSEDGGNTSPSKKKPDRLMLRVEGIEGASLASSGEFRLSGDRSGQGSGSGSGTGSGQKGLDGEDYNTLVNEFDTRMSMLKKVVDAGEEMQTKISEGTELGGGTQDDAAAAPTNTEGLSASVESG